MDSEYSSFISSAADALSSDRAKTLLYDISNMKKDAPVALNKIIDFLAGKSNYTEILIFLFFTIFILIGLKLVLNMAKNGQLISSCISSILSLYLCCNIFDIIKTAVSYVREISVFLGVLSPITGILTASGGNIQTAKVNGFSFSLFLGICQLFLNYLLPIVITLFIGAAVIDAMSGGGKMIGVSQSVKSLLFTVFAITIAIIFIIIGFFYKSAVSTDSISSKAIKLIISNSIPIIGGTVGDALRFMSSGLITIKNSIGVTSVIFIIGLCIPYLITLLVYNFILNFFGSLCDCFCINDFKGVLVHLRCAIEFIVASFAVIIILAVLNIGLFMNSVPNYYL